MTAEFIAEQGVLKGVVLSLEEGEQWVLGRDPDQADIIVEDPKVSRRHLLCRLTPEGYIIENLSESNPVKVNNHPITEPTLLKEEDLVTIGDSIFRFYEEAPSFGVAFREETLPYEGGDEFEEEEEIFEEEEEPVSSEEPSLPEEPAPAEEVEAEEPSLPEEPTPVEEVEAEEPSLPEEPTLVEEVEAEEPSLPEEPTLVEEVEAEEPSLPEEPTPAFEEEEEEEEETIFEEAEIPDLHLDLTPTTRFILKVIAGPNTGAEFALDFDRNYLIGTDTATCDIVFNDLSVSREHARLSISGDGFVLIEDLNSRNGVVVNRERIVGKKELTANSIIALGTSAFLLVDREAPSETITAPIFEAPPTEEIPSEEEVGVPEEGEAIVLRRPKRGALSVGSLILALFVAGLAVIFGIGVVSLLQTREVETAPRDYLSEIQSVMKDFPGVRFTYNAASGKLFLLGHVLNGIQHNELLYKLRGLIFIKGVEDNIVNDEAVWQEMNILLSKQSMFKGVSMHSPEPGVFVLSGYLQTEKQASDLMDYINVNFNYLSLLQNRVVVEEQVVEEIMSQLLQRGFGGVTVKFMNGELSLTGYITSTQTFEFEQLTEAFKKIPGVRVVRNFVVTVSPEQGVIDLNKRYPGRYRVTGYSKHGDVNVNVVINGRILTRGDQIDGMTITSIHPDTIFLEKDGLKYKIEYNK